MNPGIPLALLQLRREKKRVAAAITGIFFAVLLMLVQLGFQDALLTSAGLHIHALNCDVILASPHYQYLIQSDSIPERRLYQAAGDWRVARVTPLYIGSAPWKNPLTRAERVIVLLGVPVVGGTFTRPEIEARIDALKDPEAALFDAKGRPEFGPVPEMFRRGEPVTAEILHRRVAIAGLFEIGTTFGIDGTVILNELGFRRIIPGGASASPSLGLIRLIPGANADEVRAALAATLPPDVRVYTRDEFVLHEQQYWSTNTPIGFLFKLGVGMGLVVGLIVVYQILYTDVMEHLGEYATLKAIGYTNRYLFGIVLQQGILLSIGGFVPGLLASIVVYRVTATATFLPLAMTWERGALVYGLTLGMCMMAAALAMRPVSTIDPAEICTR